MTDAAHQVIDHAAHTAFSDPGHYSALFDAVPPTPEGVSGVARNLIVHYVASGLELPAESKSDVHSRWLDEILRLDQGRHSRPLVEEREPVERVQGCCRDHTLFCLGVLRHHGIPARSRVGFSGYILDSWRFDHVIVEAWIDGRWRRFDPEVGEPLPLLASPMDMAHSAVDDSGFVTAAQVWDAYRRTDLDPAIYGVAPDLPLFAGERFIFDEVIYEVAHRFGDELLLWDGWGRIGEPGTPVSDEDAAWVDPIVALLLAADRGDLNAEHELYRRYREDHGLHPGPTIDRWSPYGEALVTVDLESRSLR